MHPRAFLLLGLLLLIINTLAYPLAANSDSLDSQRMRIALISKGSLYAGSLIGLNELWYSEYERSSFQFHNDNADWLQMDKAGHAISTYTISLISSDVFIWTGMEPSKAAIWGSVTGFSYLAIIEILDGFSAGWGASMGDVAANTFGAGVFLAQALAWQEQKIQLKYSYHSSGHAEKRPELLGSNLPERMLKDYNGHTAWLSFNPMTFTSNSSMPPWINLALGYSGNGLLGAAKNPAAYDHITRYRQYYLSLDVNWRKIPTNSKTLEFVFKILSFYKIPFPAVEFSRKGTTVHPLYF